LPSRHVGVIERPLFVGPGGGGGWQGGDHRFSWQYLPIGDRQQAIRAGAHRHSL
jgi:hypothetical protein